MSKIPEILTPTEIAKRQAGINKRQKEQEERDRKKAHNKGQRRARREAEQIQRDLLKYQAP